MGDCRIMKHQAIYELHTNVKRIEENDDGTLNCYDDNDNVVTFTSAEETAITAKDTELNNAHELKRLRNKRDKLIAETDYWGSPDLPAMTTAQTNYRQALRDITNTYTSLDTVVWPTKP